MGIVSPVISVSCDYKHPTTFSDKVSISITVKEFKGVTLCLAYRMLNQDGIEVCVGTSSHAFLNSEGRPIRMKRDYPEFWEVLNKFT